MLSAEVSARRKQRQARHRHALALFLLGGGFLLLGMGALLALLNPARSPGTAEASQPGAPAEVDFPAPALKLTDMQGNAVALEDSLGLVILVNNFATWCPPCRAELPILEAYYQAHKDQGFTLIGIEAGEPADQVAAFAEKFEINFPVWLDPYQEALLAFHNPALPSSYVIDREGRVRLAWSGAVSLEALDRYVTPLLKR